MPKYVLTINGARRPLDVADPEMPLLWALRDRLGMTGTKYGCGVGVCGACTVHVDGKAMRSCQVPVSSLSGHRVTTIEGLSRDGRHPCQRVWLEEDVAQCGYCQPGMIMECAAALAGPVRASQESVEAALSEHVCRCGTYGRMRRAVARLVESPRGVR
jgi:isoquinoline 1-oxidoreductase alpha subunit